MSRRKRSGKQDDVLSLSDHSEYNSVHTKSDTSNLSDSGSNDEYEITRKSPQRAPLRSVISHVNVGFKPLTVYYGILRIWLLRV
ncbi:hypothetical protein DPMN_107271 [Dreissena polymorpha]|uniref:Uncharacterized protein n=1 Tax=Dreissena polymorpha TaxID=45954 RepID=A0A9D4K6U8_DREPO|nr:hypothetical protein DPMN_107265 [Dreissena polymorpha]KAH3833952.1 hypothetical protein DPMN_107268 [Dreissena polymorpha]KAH3833955.1 hypothetical protein DPMN_107271 [Dreissena polymorpha]